MKVSLINPNSAFLENPCFVPPLGLLTVARILKEVDVDIEWIDLAKDPAYDLHRIKSDIVGVTGTTVHYDEFSRIAKALSGLRLVAGGPHANACPDTLTRLGYQIGGIKPSEIIRAMTGKTVSETIDNVFFPPDRTLFDRSVYTGPASVFLSQGCPFKCSFCAKKSGQYYYKYKLEDVARDIDQLYSDGYREITFFDDWFGSNPTYLKALCGYLKTKANLKWRCLIRTNSLTPEALLMMKEAGLDEVSVGVESGSQRILDAVRKQTKVEANTRARQFCRELGIKYKAYIIYGLPGESESTLAETYQWLADNQPDHIGLYLYMPLPGSDIFDHPERYDIRIQQVPYSRMYYAGNPFAMKSVVATSQIDEAGITRFFHKTIRDFNLFTPARTPEAVPILT